MPGSHHLLSSLVLPEISRCLWCARRSTLERVGFDLSSLISSFLNSSYQYFSMQKFLKPFSGKCKRPFSCCPPKSNESKSPSSCANHELLLELLQAGIWQELPFGNRDPALALACDGVAMPGSPCPPAQSHLLAHNSGFAVQVCRLAAHTAN